MSSATLAHAIGKLTAAVTSLAVHPGNIRQRLGVAATEVFLISPSNLPPAERISEDASWIQEQLTTRNGATSSVSKTLHGMRNKRAVAIAERIVELDAKLRWYVDVNSKET